MEFKFALVAVLLIAQASAKSFDALPSFSILESRQASGAPEIHVTFASGHHDTLTLERADNHEGSCNYLGHLTSTKTDSSVAVTGCLTGNAEDKLSITLLSPHFKGTHLFTVDAQGNVEAHESPFINNKSEMVSMDEADDITIRNAEDDGWKLAEGDDMLNSDFEAANAEALASCTSADTCVLPARMKAVMQFGYETSLKNKMAGLNQSPSAWMHEVFTHTRAHFKHSSLTTEIEFEILDEIVYHEATWTADSNIVNARLAMLEKGAANIDAMIWFMNDPRYWGIIGRAYSTALCSPYYKVSVNEWRSTTAATGELVAHELGHNFGMRHDFDHDDNTCRGIMDYLNNDPVWSTCNVADLKAAYVSRGWANGCLETITPATPAPTSAPATTTTPAPTCVSSWIGDGYCDVENNSEGCQFDGEDCCEPYSRDDWTKYCGTNCVCKNPVTTTTSAPTPAPTPAPINCSESWIGDGYCDVENNNEKCQFDKGDCCEPHDRDDWDNYCGENCVCL